MRFLIKNHHQEQRFPIISIHKKVHFPIKGINGKIIFNYHGIILSTFTVPVVPFFRLSNSNYVVVFCQRVLLYKKDMYYCTKVLKDLFEKGGEYSLAGQPYIVTNEQNKIKHT